MSKTKAAGLGSGKRSIVLPNGQVITARLVGATPILEISPVVVSGSAPEPVQDWVVCLGARKYSGSGAVFRILRVATYSEGFDSQLSDFDFEELATESEYSVVVSGVPSPVIPTYDVSFNADYTELVAATTFTTSSPVSTFEAVMRFDVDILFNGALTANAVWGEFSGVAASAVFVPTGVHVALGKQFDAADKNYVYWPTGSTRQILQFTNDTTYANQSLTGYVMPSRGHLETIYLQGQRIIVMRAGVVQYDVIGPHGGFYASGLDMATNGAVTKLLVPGRKLNTSPDPVNESPAVLLFDVSYNEDGLIESVAYNSLVYVSLPDQTTGVTWDGRFVGLACSANADYVFATYTVSRAEDAGAKRDLLVRIPASLFSAAGTAIGSLNTLVSEVEVLFDSFGANDLAPSGSVDNDGRLLLAPDENHVLFAADGALRLLRLSDGELEDATYAVATYDKYLLWPKGQAFPARTV
ncbi:MAG: hypothetical protein KDA57_16155 [Planctomycetales bacterium]|nr:hypothetical protein [Planctomycetales bacterium]